MLMLVSSKDVLCLKMALQTRQVDAVTDLLGEVSNKLGLFAWPVCPGLHLIGH